MRVAFLTPVSPSKSDGGGLGAYLYRITRSLLESGHEPEVFVPCHASSRTDFSIGLPIHRVSIKQDQPVLGFLSAASTRIIRLEAWRHLVTWVLQARALAAALERRHAVAPFQLVQSADYLVPGLLVRKIPARVHAVRCSTAMDLWTKANGIRGSTDICEEYLERLAIRRADVRYAPSRFIADHFRRAHNIDVRVVRPPAYFDTSSLLLPSVYLPNRFFLHFGQLTELKGTALLARALPIAWEKAPDLTMVWSGWTPHKDKVEEWRSLWGRRGNQVHITGLLSRPEMYAVLQRADAAILPSQADNLPNTVIESLAFGVPVLGSRGASIDELVEDGRTGHLVPLGDVHALAEALAMMWLKQTQVSKGFESDCLIFEEMQPKQAVINLVQLYHAEMSRRQVNQSLAGFTSGSRV